MNIEVNFDNLTKEEQEQFNVLVEKANKPKRIWKPEIGEWYYCVNGSTSLGVNCFKYMEESFFDKHAYFIGNCFKTREEAEFALERLKVIAEMKRYITEHDNVELDWKNGRQMKYLLEYNYEQDKVFQGFTYIVASGGIYASNVKTIEGMIKEIGEYRIKKYYFGVE